MKKIILLFILIVSLQAGAQSLYFPPNIGSTWDTIAPASIGWCQPGIDSLYSYLNQTGTDAFIVLKDGKIILEKYFGTFTVDSPHYWASAGKSLMGMLTGVAQDKGLVNINSPVSNYLGNGWSAAPVVKESQITFRHLLAMTSGLDDNPAAPCDNQSTASSCLQYLTDTGKRWAYHTGAYQQLAAVITAVSGSSINAFTNANINNRIGTTGLWVNGVYYSKARSMARFGLLALNKGVWANDSILKSSAYWNDMINTSQNYNDAYGFLWWLNGKSSFMSPGLQLVFNGSLIPNAPPDMFAALGKNDQKIYVVPGKGLVVIRVGESTYGTALAFSPFDDLLWGKIDSLDYKCSYTFTGNGNWNVASNWSNNLIPPAILAKDAVITINPITGGECILNIPQTISKGSNLLVKPGAQFKLLGNLTILNQ